MAINTYISLIESKNQKHKQTKQTTRTRTESQIQRSSGELSAVWGKGENGGKGTGIKKHNWYLQNRQGEVKNNIGNGEAKELTCMTHGHERRWGNDGGRGVQGGGE